MHISLRWLNEYLDPGDISAAEAERILTFAGFPIESVTTLPNGDVMLDVEVTSNRGDVLSHIGVAREIAASGGGRTLKLPAPGKIFNWFDESEAGVDGGGGGGGGGGVQDVGATLAVENRVPESCPMFTARVITGVRVGPSPRWLAAALEGVGQRSINNVVDITNFVSFECGQPSHVFDLEAITRGADGKARLVVRAAGKGEKLTMLDGRVLDLRGDEIVVADGETGGRALSLAGVMGGQDSGVSARTTSVALEAATWEPVAIRRSARRYNLRTDASYRFERIVDPRTIEPAGRRLAALICKLAGGKLLPGVIEAGPAPRPPSVVKLRPSRVCAILGVAVPMPVLQRILESHEIAARPEAVGTGSPEPSLSCTIPPHRPDLEREIDLIEEVARTHGLDKLPEHEMVPVRVAGPQPGERAVQAIGQTLTGLGFYETVTFTFVSPKQAKPFLPSGQNLMIVCDDRRKQDPALRPSALPSMLACRRANQDRGVQPDGAVGGAGAGGGGGLRLFELSAVFAETPPPSAKKGERGTQVESVNLALLADCCFPAGAKATEQKQSAIRLVRGAIESISRALGGEATRVEIVPSAAPPVSAYDPGAFAEVRINDRQVGRLGLIGASVQGEHGLETPVVAAELDLAALVALYPPRSLVRALPAFPSIERDLSLIVREETAWAKIDALVGSLRVPLLESWAFVGAYRGQQAGAGKKSVTFRMRFRDPARTLTHDEVSPQVETIVGAAKKELGAEVRRV
jgi:phenylalanyl-tRNA synthetase beta chain